MTDPPSPTARGDLFAGTRPTQVPGVPEITLALASEPFDLWVDEAEPLPYWAFAWPGGQVLARWWLDRPELVRNRCVLDIGCASGLVGIAAAMAGARDVTCVDIDPHAVAAAGRNAITNGVSVHTWCGDILTEPLGLDQQNLVAAAQIVAAGDLLYEAELAELTMARLRACARAGAWALAGDAGRAYTPTSGIRRLLETDIAVHRAVEPGPTRHVAVFEVDPR